MSGRSCTFVPPWSSAVVVAATTPSSSSSRSLWTGSDAGRTRELHTLAIHTSRELIISSKLRSIVEHYSSMSFLSMKGQCRAQSSGIEADECLWSGCRPSSVMHRQAYKAWESTAFSSLGIRGPLLLHNNSGKPSRCPRDDMETQAESTT